MEIFTQEKLELLNNLSKVDLESSVGEFKKGESHEEDVNQKPYLEYPGVKDLYEQIQKSIDSGKTVRFKTKKIFDSNFESKQESFLNSDSKQITNQFSGLMIPHFGSLLSTNYSGQKVLGNCSIAYIEAKTSRECFEHYHSENTVVDHFYTAKGVCNLNTLEEALKAYEIKKNEPIILLLPENAIKAFRKGPFSGWQLPEHESVNSSIGKLNYIDKKDRKTLGEIRLIDYKIKNLDAPLYKIKIDGKWILVVLKGTNYEELHNDVDIKVSKDLIESIKSNLNTKPVENYNVTEINCSLGQAVRVVFELFGGDYDAIPEIMLNFEGGSWSSIALENSSCTRHSGTNSMHEVIKNAWYKHPDLAVPWNYTSFDQLNENNKHLLENENIYLLSLETTEINGKSKVNYFIECPQNWKKVQMDLIHFVTKFIYREYSNLGSKKFLLSTKELISIAASFLANLSINNFDVSKVEYHEGIKKLNVQNELLDLLELIAYVHLFCSSKADFYSSKTHPTSIARVQCLSKIYKKLEQINTVSAKNFYNKTCEILARDICTESTTLLLLFKNELGK